MPSTLIQHHYCDDDLNLIQQLPRCICYTDHALVSNKRSFYIKYNPKISMRGREKTSKSRWASCPPSHCQDVLQGAHSSTDCPAEWVRRIYVHGCAAADHKPTFSSRAQNIQQRFTNPNFPLQVKELYKLFLGFIHLLLVGQRMMLLPFTPAIHVGKSVLSSYIKRSAHSQDFFFLRRRKDLGVTLRKVPINPQQIHITRTIMLQELNV